MSGNAFYEEGGIRFSELNTQEKKKSFALFVGSEGGFDERKDCQKPVLRQYGWEKRILRCETAPPDCHFDFDVSIKKIYKFNVEIYLNYDIII